METRAMTAVRSIKADYKAGKGTIKELCQKYGISNPTYYKLRGKRKVRTKNTPESNFVDVPLHTDERIFVVACNIETLGRVLRSL